MFKNYIKTAYRNLKKDKQFTALNVIGLSAGIACTLLIYLWVHDELSYDKFFDNSDRIYQVMEHRTGGGSQQLTDESSGAVSEVLKIQNPEVQYAAAVAPPEWFSKFTLSSGDKVIKATGQYTGKDYFNIFSFKMLQGDRSKVLAANSSIVISESLAKRIFGSVQNAFGKSIKFQHEKDFFVTGIFKDVPVHSSQQFDFVLSFNYLATVPGQQWVKQWNGGGPHNFVMLKKGADVNALNKRIVSLITKNSGDTTRFTFVTKFADNYLQNTFTHGARVGGKMEYVKLFSLIAVFILIIACINFMNLSTAKASGRMKEIGIKKVVGAERSQLILQFLSESLLLAFITTCLAVGITWLLLPQFNQITGKTISLQLDASLVIMLFSIAVFTGLVSGSYPALYLSASKPLEILKNKLNSSVTELVARKGLVVFQFMLSVMLLVAVMVVYRQIKFIQSTNPGYNKDNVIRFDDEGVLQGKEEEFAESLKRIPGVENASFTTHNIVGRNFGTAEVSWDTDQSKKTYFEGFFGGYNLLETLGMQMALGRMFSKDFGADRQKVILNQTAVKAMHLSNPIGSNIKIFGNPTQVVGVVKDFHFESLHQVVVPAFIMLGGGSPWNKFIVRIKAANQQQTTDQIKRLYESYNPGFLFNYNFLDESYQRQYETETRISSLSKYFSVLAILISCLGLFGLVAFTAQKRKKEIGIRKVIGASVNKIALMLMRDFFKLVMVAILIAFPLIGYAMHIWLQGFAYRIRITWVEFIAAGVAVLFITLITVGFQALRAGLANPVKSLRSE